MKFRKKPVVIEAVQLLWHDWSEMCEHAGVGRLEDGKPTGVRIDADGTVRDEHHDVVASCKAPPGDEGRIGLLIPTKEGVMLATQGDWVIRGVQGELYPCKPDIFEATYEKAE